MAAHGHAGHYSDTVKESDEEKNFLTGNMYSNYAILIECPSRNEDLLRITFDHKAEIWQESSPRESEKTVFG